MKAKLLSLSGNSAVVMYGDLDGVLQTIIVDSKEVNINKIGDEFELTDKAIKHSTSFGIDWSVVFPDGITISVLEIQNLMYNNGIISVKDLRSNSNKFRELLSSMINKKFAEIHKYVKHFVGG